MFKRGRTLKRYEVQNLIFFLCFILALGGLGAYVFQSYKDRDKEPPKPFDPNGILTEVVSQASNSCYFYLGTKLTESNRKYRNKSEIGTNDDGFIKDLFDISGVIEVQVDQQMVVLQKSTKAHWEEIQPAAREVITAHLHMHK